MQKQDDLFTKLFMIFANIILRPFFRCIFLWFSSLFVFSTPKFVKEIHKMQTTEIVEHRRVRYKDEDIYQTIPDDDLVRLEAANLNQQEEQKHQLRQAAMPKLYAAKKYYCNDVTESPPPHSNRTTACSSTHNSCWRDASCIPVGYDLEVDTVCSFEHAGSPIVASETVLSMVCPTIGS
jgi:hypothetical protein